MPYLRFSEQTIYYRQQGSQRSPILLIHGAGGSSLHFDEMLRFLGQKYWTVAIDLPGHGKSRPFVPLPSPAHLLEQYSDVAAEVAERLGLGRFVAIGHSMGGAVALEFARRYSDRIAGMVLIAAAARYSISLELLSLVRHHIDQLPRFMADIGYSPASYRPQVETLAERQLQASQEIILADFEACSITDLREQALGINCPTLILSAAEDRLTPPGLQEQLASLLPCARLERLSRSGHFVITERPDRVAEQILQFMESIAVA